MLLLLSIAVQDTWMQCKCSQAVTMGNLPQHLRERIYCQRNGQHTRVYRSNYLYYSAFSQTDSPHSSNVHVLMKTLSKHPLISW